MKFTTHITHSQVKDERKSPKIKALLHYIHLEYDRSLYEKDRIDAIERYLCNAPPSRRKGLDFFIKLLSRFSRIFPSHEAIARAAGLASRMSGFRISHDLQDMGIIRSYRRKKDGIDETCLYEINQCVLTEYAQKRLSHLLPSLSRLLTLVLLTSMYQKTHSDAIVTLSKNIYSKTFSLSPDHWPLAPNLIQKYTKTLPQRPVGAPAYPSGISTSLLKERLEPINGKIMDFEKIEALLTNGKLLESEKRELENYPEIAINYAIGLLQANKKLVEFGYFRAVVKAFLSKRAPSKKVEAHHPYKPYIPTYDTSDDRVQKRIEAAKRAYVFEQRRGYKDMSPNPEWRNLYASQKCELFVLFPALKEIYYRDYGIVGEDRINNSLPSLQENV